MSSHSTSRSSKAKVVGILGGMGPEATADVFRRIIKATPARRDQDHIRVIINNNPRIVDRTAVILSQGIGCLSEIIETARNLEKSGADFIIIPCNTAHYYYEELTKKVGVPVLNMIDLTAQAIEERFPNVRKVGILGTTGTIRSRIYNVALEKRGIEVIYPSEEIQKLIMKIIYCNIKAGDVRARYTVEREIMRAAEHLIKKEAELIVLGCTELSLALKNRDISVPLVDPLQVLAEKAVVEALQPHT